MSRKRKNKVKATFYTEKEEEEVPPFEEITIIKVNKSFDGDIDELPNNMPLLVNNNGKASLVSMAPVDSRFCIVLKDYNADELAKIKPSAIGKFKKIPFSLFWRIVGFLRDVYEAHKTEAKVLLYYNPDKEDWTVKVPEQECSGASVSYDLDAEFINSIPDGYVLFGSIHSHPTFSASQSHIDKEEDEEIPGIHLTVGDLNQIFPSIHHRVVIGKTEYKFDLSDVIDINIPVQIDNEHESEFDVNKISIHRISATKHSGYMGYYLGARDDFDSGFESSYERRWRQHNYDDEKQVEIKRLPSKTRYIYKRK